MIAFFTQSSHILCGQDVVSLCTLMHLLQLIVWVISGKVQGIWVLLEWKIFRQRDVRGQLHPRSPHVAVFTNWPSFSLSLPLPGRMLSPNCVDCSASSPHPSLSPTLFMFCLIYLSQCGVISFVFIHEHIIYKNNVM